MQHQDKDASRKSEEDSSLMVPVTIADTISDNSAAETGTDSVSEEQKRQREQERLLQEARAENEALKQENLALSNQTKKLKSEVSESVRDYELRNLREPMRGFCWPVCL